jgi:hypothetical protein
MGKQASIQHAPGDTVGDKHGSAGDEAIHDDDTVLVRCLQDRSHKRRDLEPAEIRELLHWI